MRKFVIHIAKNYTEKELKEFLKGFTYKPELTDYLDGLPAKPFSQETINEIVLWKINRYAELSETIRQELHKFRKLKSGEHTKAKIILEKLLNCDGVDLPMASTFLRFLNANVFQIIDRHAYRALFGISYRLYSGSKIERKVSIYFKYLDELHKLAKLKNVRFRDLDRILYELDKKENGPLEK